MTAGAEAAPGHPAEATAAAAGGGDKRAGALPPLPPARASRSAPGRAPRRKGRSRAVPAGGRETPVPSGAAKPRSPQGPPPKLVLLGGLVAGRRLFPQPAGEPRGREEPLTALMAGEGLSHPRCFWDGFFLFFSFPDGVSDRGSGPCRCARGRTAARRA